MDTMEIQAKIDELNAQRDKIKEELGNLTQQLRFNSVVAKVNAALSSLTDEDKQKLSQVISKAGGIDSKEAVGTPGT